MKVLVIGSNGQLGYDLCRQGKRQGFDIMGVDIPDFDITNEEQVAEWTKKVSPQLVVNASAYTAVDKAESEAELAYKVNAGGPRNLAKVCAFHNIPLIHISTDYVFAGEKNAPYDETDTIAPTGIYGKSKAAGEMAIREALRFHIIIRTAWLYGLNGNNFVKTMLKLGKDNETLSVVDDQHGCPTYSADLADVIFTIADQVKTTNDNQWGTYHYCGGGETTWYEFAEAVFDIARTKTELKVKEVIPVSTDEYPTPAKRPANSVLDCNRIKNTFHINIRPWKESLREMLAHLLTDKNHL